MFVCLFVYSADRQQGCPPMIGKVSNLNLKSKTCNIDTYIHKYMTTYTILAEITLIATLALLSQKKIYLWTPGNKVIRMSWQSAEQSVLHRIHSSDGLMEDGAVASSPLRHANGETA